MRFISLTEQETETLEQGSRHHDKPYFRQRCECLLLSNRGYRVGQMADLFQTRTHTIRAWMDSWLEKGLCGLYIQAGRGRKGAIGADQAPLVEDIKAQIALHPQDLDAVARLVGQKWGLSLSKEQIKRFLKKN
jgi:transposase